MNTAIEKIKRTLLLVASLIPSRLPQGVAEFNKWADSIIRIGDFPTNSREDILFVLSTMIMHFGATEAYVPKMRFILAVKATAAKQIAGSVFQGVKERQAAARMAEQEKQAEVTAKSMEALVNEVLRNS